MCYDLLKLTILGGFYYMSKLQYILVQYIIPVAIGTLFYKILDNMSLTDNVWIPRIIGGLITIIVAIGAMLWIKKNSNL